MPKSAGRNVCSLSQSVNAYKLHPPNLHLSGCRYNFRAREQEVAALEGLQQKALAAWYRSTIAPGGKQRRKLCVQVTASLFPFPFTLLCARLQSCGGVRYCGHSLMHDLLDAGAAPQIPAYTTVPSNLHKWHHAGGGTGACGRSGGGASGGGLDNHR